MPHPHQATQWHTPPTGQAAGLTADTYDLPREWPSPPARRAYLAFVPVPARVRDVRHTVEVLLGQWGIAETVTEVAVLIASELTTNAVVHAGGSGSIGVEVRVTDGAVQLAVHDERPEVPIPRLGGLSEEESGRGLALVAAIADEWGTVLHSNGDKSVWAALRCRPHRPAG